MQPVRTLGFQALTLFVTILMWEEGRLVFNVDLEYGVGLFGSDIYKGCVAIRDSGIEGIDRIGSFGISRASLI